jgi:uncharacterized membrane protein
VPDHIINSTRQYFSGRYSWAGFLLGFAMGGFFDGILLHQILQWHHLLSLVDSPLVADMRTQIIADGVFHALMYVIAAIALWMLLRARQELAGPHAARRLLANALIGFGAWNMADAILFHWIFQLHRIRIDSDVPLAWDLTWFAVFGLAFVIAGGFLRQRESAQNPSGPHQGGSVAAVLASAVIGAALAASLPPRDSAATVVLFKSDMTPPEISRALDAVDARVLWADPGGSVWAVNVAEGRNARSLYRHGALLVSNSAFGLSCLSWLRA